MGSTLSHRGPDDSGEYIGEHADFAHKRLAVVDEINKPSKNSEYVK